MNSGITYLDLPKLDQSLHDRLVQVADNMPTQPAETDWVSNYHGYRNLDFSYTDNFGKGKQRDGETGTIPWDIIEELREQFRPYFGTVYPSIIQFVNSEPTQGPTHAGPHCDMFRPVGLNYQLRAGGSDVVTRFFTETRREPDKTLIQSEHEREENLQVHKEYSVPIATWHVVETQRFHMVANVETKRSVLALVLEDLQLTYQTFCDRYKHLIIKDPT